MRAIRRNERENEDGLATLLRLKNAFCTLGYMCPWLGSSRGRTILNNSNRNRLCKVSHDFYTRIVHLVY
jgi:hypothetical protein